MSFDVTLHDLIEKYNILQKPTELISEGFKNHPNFFKAALLVNHGFRAAAMTAFCWALPFSAPTNISICFAGSLFYRLTVETNCAYKFALPAFAGSIAIPMAVAALNQLTSGIAFVSLRSTATAFGSLLPFAIYATYIVLTVNYDVNNH